MVDVTVIVPVYNTSKYLRRSLDALCNQTLKNIEVLLVNDGSTDSSLEIMEEYRKQYGEKVRILNKENGGQATARNMGIREANGKYIGFADSDDYIDKTMFQKMFELAERDNADFVECHYHCLYETDKGVSEIPTRGRIREYKDQKDMFIDPQVSPWNKLYKRELLIDNKIYFPEGVIYEDTAFYIKTIPHIKKSSYLDEKLVYYCVRQNSTMTANKSVKVADIFTVLEDIISYYRNNGFYEEYKKELEYFYTKIALCSSLTRIGRADDRILRKQLIDKTFVLLNSKFPEYKENDYFSGKIGFYIKHIDRFSASVVSPVMGKLVKG